MSLCGPLIGKSNQTLQPTSQGDQLRVQHSAMNSLKNGGPRPTLKLYDNDRDLFTNPNKNKQKKVPEPDSVDSEPPALSRTKHHESTGNTQPNTVLHERTSSPPKPSTHQFRGNLIPPAPPPLNALSSSKANLAKFPEKGRARHILDRRVPSGQVTEMPTSFNQPPETSFSNGNSTHVLHPHESTTPAFRTPATIPGQFGRKQLAYPSDGKDGKLLKKASTQTAPSESLRQHDGSIFQELHSKKSSANMVATSQTAGPAKKSIDHTLPPTGAPSVPSSGHAKTLTTENRTSGTNESHSERFLCPELTVTSPTNDRAKQQDHSKDTMAPKAMPIPNNDSLSPNSSEDLPKAALMQSTTQPLFSSVYAKDRSLTPSTHSGPPDGESLSFAPKATNSHEMHDSTNQTPQVKDKENLTGSQTLNTNEYPGAATEKQAPCDTVMEATGGETQPAANLNRLNKFKEHLHRPGRLSQKGKARRTAHRARRRRARSSTVKCSGPPAVDYEDNQYKVEELEKFDSATDRFYLKWDGYPRQENQWVHRLDIHPHLIHQYWTRKRLERKRLAGVGPINTIR